MLDEGTNGVPQELVQRCLHYVLVVENLFILPFFKFSRVKLTTAADDSPPDKELNRNWLYLVKDECDRKLNETSYRLTSSRVLHPSIQRQTGHRRINYNRQQFTPTFLYYLGTIWLTGLFWILLRIQLKFWIKHQIQLRWLESHLKRV